MAVTKTQDWATVSLSSATPSGSVTIGSGTNRTLLFVQGIENAGTASTSVGIGNIAAANTGRVFWESGGAGDLQINYWYFAEDELSAMSGTGIAYSGPILNKQAWTYATFSSCDQDSPVIFANAVSLSISNSVGLGVATVGDGSDFVVIAGCRDTQNRTFGAFGSLTEQIDADGNTFRFGLGDGAWYANSVTVTGDSAVQDVMLLASFVIKALSSNPTGTGDITSPSATVSGDGDVGTNDLKPAAIAVSGVGERSVVWEGAVALTAPGPTLSTTANQYGGSGGLECFFPVLEGSGQREHTGSGAISATSITVSGVGAHGYLGSGALSAPVAITANSIDFGAIWYASKEVYFL